MLDLSILRKQLDAMQSRGSSNNLKWSPEVGESVIRILPYKFQPGNPFIDLYMYYTGDGRVVKKSYVSPISFSNPDPIAEFSEHCMGLANEAQNKAKAEKNEAAINRAKEDWKTARNLGPILRTHVAIIVRGNEKEGVKFWNFAGRIKEQLLKILLDPDWGDFTDLNEGRDIVVSKIESSKPGLKYEIDVRLKPKPTPASTDPEIIKLIEDMPPITELYTEPTYETLKAELDAFINGISNGAKETETTINVSSTSTNTPNSATADAVLGGDTTIFNSGKDAGEIADTVLSDVESEFDSFFKKK